MVRKFLIAFAIVSGVVSIGYFMPHPPINRDDEAPNPSIIEHVDHANNSRVLPPVILSVSAV